MSLKEHRIAEKWSFNWKCPKCKKNNIFTWDYVDLPMVGDVIHMHCEYCKESSEMVCKLKRLKK